MGHRSRRVSFSTRLAWRSTFTAAVAIVVAIVLTQTALPKLANEVGGTKADLPVAITRLVVSPGLLPYLPAPAFLLGFAALVFCPLRPVLALLSAATCLIAIIVLVMTLVAAMIPLYQVSQDLGLNS